MWYVIQTTSGKEHEVCMWINTYVDKNFYKRCFVPLYEDVWRQGGIAHSEIKRLFPGYLFIETDVPDKVYESLKNIMQFASILFLDDKTGKCFIPLYKDEEVFFDTILSEGIMTVSYVHKNKSGKVDKVIGPLKYYLEHIHKLDTQHRRAIVNIPLLGKCKRIKFGLWLDIDPKKDWIEEEKKAKSNDINIEEMFPDNQWDWEAWKVVNKNINDRKNKIVDEDIYGYKVGDYVINTTGIYGDTPLEIKEILTEKKSVKVNAMLFGGITSVEMKMENIVLSKDASI